jgi:hypothetical protein
MRRLRITRITALQLGAAVALALALPLASQASTTTGSSPGAPIVNTAGATRVNPPSAVLQGSIDPRTLATKYWFEYGPTAAYGFRSAVGTLASGSTKIRVSQPVSGIQLGEHYRLVAENADGARDGHDRILTTKQKAAFVLPKTFQATPLDDAFILNGTLIGPGNANRPVVLQESPYPYRTAYTNVGAPINTDAAGRFSFRVAKLTLSTKFRVSTIGAKPVYSPVVPELVTVRVALKVRSTRSAPGIVRLYGTVTPAEVGAHVFVQLEKPPKTSGSEEKAPKGEKPIKPEKTKKSGKSNKRQSKAENSEKLPTYLTEFDTVVKPGTRALSRFSIIVKIQVPGHYRVFVGVRPGPLASGHSGSIYLHADPNSSHGSHKKKRKKHHRK